MIKTECTAILSMCMCV